MLNNLPQQYRGDPWVKTLDQAFSVILNEHRTVTDSIPAQLAVDTMTWALSVEERVAGIIPPQGASLEARRSALKAKWRSGGRASLEQIQAVSDSWKNGQVSVEFTGGRIVIRFIGIVGVPEDMAGLKRAIALVVPAHLPVDYIIVYNTWADVKAHTWGELKTRTWSEVKESDLNG